MSGKKSGCCATDRVSVWHLHAVFVCTRSRSTVDHLLNASKTDDLAAVKRFQHTIYFKRIKFPCMVNIHVILARCSLYNHARFAHIIAVWYGVAAPMTPNTFFFSHFGFFVVVVASWTACSSSFQIICKCTTTNSIRLFAILSLCLCVSLRRFCFVFFLFFQLWNRFIGLLYLHINNNNDQTLYFIPFWRSVLAWNLLAFRGIVSIYLFIVVVGFEVWSSTHCFSIYAQLTIFILPLQSLHVHATFRTLIERQRTAFNCMSHSYWLVRVLK